MAYFRSHWDIIYNNVNTNSARIKRIASTSYVLDSYKMFYGYITFDPRNKTVCQENNRALWLIKGMWESDFPGSNPACILITHVTICKLPDSKFLSLSVFFKWGQHWWLIQKGSYEKIELIIVLFFNRWKKPGFR